MSLLLTVASACDLVVPSRQRARATGSTGPPGSPTPTPTPVPAPPAYAGTRTQLVDTAEGPDWKRANAPLNILWERPGGDWSDATGIRFGAKPFASMTVKNYGVQACSWDVTALTRKLLTDNTGIILRLVSGSGGLKFASSRMTDQRAPALTVVTSAGTIVCPLVVNLVIDPSGGALGRLDWLALPSLTLRLT